MGSLGNQAEYYDVLIIGAGLSGICTLYHIRERFPSWRVKVIEASGGVGGTWEFLNEWNWKETFSPQPEILKYLQRISEIHKLYKDIQFNTRVKSARWQDAGHTWLFADETDTEYRARFFISCMGFLSSPTLPAISDIETFEGAAFHTSRWPKDLDVRRDFANKRIGIIGTGATGIQTTTALSTEPSIKSLHVFQRTPNWSVPLHNTEITPKQMEKYKTEYDSVFQRCAGKPACFLHDADPRKSFEVTDEERVTLWEKLYAEPGFAKWLGAFSDTYIDCHANKLYSDFMANKIRCRVHDTAVAETLIPKSHGFGTRRVPLESGYSEAFNQGNVHLVDLQKAPIERVTANGVLTSDGMEHGLDVLIFATGSMPSLVLSALSTGTAKTVGHFSIAATPMKENEPCGPIADRVHFSD